ncbi:hypothetical protein STCU_06590 [Strigomonas culicis]|uniref:Opioid growth factor receptor (OGFr) conserved domain-containing protein n=1 Tax=Strigomonas culicis TaxID=28005 RepID=S9U9R2_9TRYP|nr:hypothetical protein STCU_06590 [Strigomonas culicis]|eukprot:EPY25653.1 hypothetical protein STCU_06590 [Strigomonas culicis]
MDADRSGTPAPADAHPSLAFYQGHRPVRVVVPAGPPPPGDATERTEDLFSIALHRRLMPPTAEATLDAEAQHESYAKQIAGEDGLALLQRNWKLLLAVLFPVLARGQTVGALQEACRRAPPPPEEEEGGREAASGAPLTLDMVATYVAQRMRPHDFRQLRDPGMLDRIHYSYVVVLRFFGWRLHDEQRGVLDRHRHWEARYAALAPRTGALAAPPPAVEVRDVGPAVSASVYAAVDLEAVPDAAPVDGTFCVYDAALLRVLQCLLQFGFITYAARLVEFVMEEITYGRLSFLLAWVGGRALPLIIASEADQSHKTRLQKRWYKLNHSDSD